MDDADESESGTDVPTWAALFERAAPRGIEEPAVRAALARRREGADD